MTFAPITSLWGGTSRPSPAFGIVALTIVLTIAFAVQTKGVWISKDNLASVLQVTATLGIMALAKPLSSRFARSTSRSVDLWYRRACLSRSGSICRSLGGRGLRNPRRFIDWRLKRAPGHANESQCTRRHARHAIYLSRALLRADGGVLVLRQRPTHGVVGLRNLRRQRDLRDQEFADLAVARRGDLARDRVHHPVRQSAACCGGDEPSALSRGVRTDMVKLVAFVAAGTLAALAGVLEASKIGFADGSFGRLQELQAIAACVIGGCALSGGRCSIVGVVFATFMLMGIQSVLVLNSVQPQWFLIFLGAMVIIAMVSDKAICRWVLRK